MLEFALADGPMIRVNASAVICIVPEVAEEEVRMLTDAQRKRDNTSSHY